TLRSIICPYTTLFRSFQNTEDKPLQFDEEAIVSAYQKDNGNQSLSIKILSIFGGILASLAFLGFLFIAGLYNSDVGLLVFGGIRSEEHTSELQSRENL